MKEMRERFLAAVSAACALGVLQALVETVMVGGVYHDLMLAPRGFMGIRYGDGYSKVLVWLRGLLGLTPAPGQFIGQGFAAKLAILPNALGVGLGMGILVGLSLAVLTLLLRREKTPRTAMGFVVLIAIFEAVVHLGLWAVNVHLPEQVTAFVAVRNFARNFIYDGTLLAMSALVIGAGLACLVVRWMGEVRTLGASVAVGLAGILCLPLVGHGGSARRGDLGRQGDVAQSQPGVRGLGIAEGYNVILISVDTLRADHTSAYGYQRDTTPTLRALAENGVRFTNTRSTTSWTLPAHLSMLTGRFQLGHGVLNDHHMLAADVPTLAERIHEAGYATGAIVSAPYLNHRYGFARGFDHYDDETVHWKTHGESYKYVTAPLVQEAAADWLAGNTKKPFFLFLHYWDPHYDYAPGKPYDTMFDPDYRGTITGDNLYFNPRINRRMDPRDLEHIIALYDGEIRLVDDYLAELRATVSKLGIADQTVIIVTGDHGEEFFEHGYKGHRRSLYDEVLHVPLVVYVPGRQPARPVVTMETSIADITPTILSLLGLPGFQGLDGADLAPVAFGHAPPWNRRIISGLYRAESLNVQLSVRERGRKIIQHFNRPRLEVYDLADDPGEEHRLPTSAGFVGSLTDTLLAYLNPAWTSYCERLGQGAGNTLEIDTETQERLRALGYAQ